MVANSLILCRLALVAIAALPAAGCATATPGIDAGIKTASIPAPAPGGKASAVAPACDTSTNFLCWLGAAMNSGNSQFAVSPATRQTPGRFDAQSGARLGGEGQDPAFAPGPQTAVEPAAPEPEDAPALAAEPIG